MSYLTLVINIAIVFIQWFFMSFVTVKCLVGILTIFFVLLLSTLYITNFVSFSSKPSPIHGGLGLILSDGIGCAIILNAGENSLGSIF